MSSSSPVIRPTLDHIVILVPYKDLAGIPERLQDALVVIDGGAHADGLTINKLVLFPDGTYLEFIAFNTDLDPEKRKGHRWGSLKEGHIIDWAFTLPGESDFKHTQESVSKQSVTFRYADPVAGGRERPDGVILKWAVAGPRYSTGTPVLPGKAPFWCFDRTERRLRVPYRDAAGPAEYTKHPSHAVGVSQVTVAVEESEIDPLKELYAALDGVSQPDDGAWPFNVPSGATDGKHKVSLTAASGSEEVEIRLTLAGTKESPRSIDLLPGVTVEFE